MRIYAYLCPVCMELMKSETCPIHPGVLLLKCYRETDDEKPAWRKLS